MEIIGKISKGSKMDQIYISKNRVGFGIGNYVLIKPLEEKKRNEKPYFYGINFIEPIKLNIISEIFSNLDKNILNYENIIIAGSFLDKGFQFNDVDIILITQDKIDSNKINKKLEEEIGIKTHILVLNNDSFLAGLETDPLYPMLLSRCVAKKRFIYKKEQKINYKLLDLHLLKSKTLLGNFDVLTGSEKYNLTRNMVAIYLYLQAKKLTNELVDNEIKKSFGFKEINELKQNLINKDHFLKKYKLIYNKTFAKILKGIENGSKQK